MHDPRRPPPLAGACPLVLAGHTHEREVRACCAAGARRSRRTRLMVEGSTGGAGLRGLEDEEPTPLAMSVLYFDDTQALQAYDDIRSAAPASRR